MWLNISWVWVNIWSLISSFIFWSWIIINIIYFLKDINELSLFLTNKNCINLYIKILDKKDPCLRLNTYWLIANLICNDNANVTQQVLFHLYMSPFFRLYIFKNLDDGVQMTETEYDMIFSILSRFLEVCNFAIGLQNYYYNKILFCQ